MPLSESGRKTAKEAVRDREEEEGGYSLRLSSILSNQETYHTKPSVLLQISRNSHWFGEPIFRGDTRHNFRQLSLDGFTLSATIPCRTKSTGPIRSTETSNVCGVRRCEATPAADT